jgi:hypothetical protein
LALEDDAEALDFFGFALAAGDFNGDDFDDLAIGVYRETVEARDRAGLVNVLYGSAVKLTAAGNDRLWAPKIGYTSQVDAAFGYTLAVGDFDADGRDDLAIGAPYEDIGAVSDTGAVYVVYGSADWLTVPGAQRWVEGGSLIGTPSANDRFGSALATGDYDGDGHSDLAIGVPGELTGGAVQVLYGFFANGLFAVGNSYWRQDALISSDGFETGDLFGGALA